MRLREPEVLADAGVRARRRARRRCRRATSSAQRPGCHGAGVGPRRASSTPTASATSRAASIGVGPRRRPARAPPAGRRATLPASATATCSGWSGSEASSAASSSCGRAPVDRRPGRVGDAAARPGPRGRRHDRAGLEQRDVGRARGRRCGAAWRAGPGAAWCACRAARRRSGWRAAAARRRASSAGIPSASRSAVADERVGERLDVAGGGERAADATPRALRRGEPVAGRRRRQRRRDGVVAAEAQHLLDEVGRVGEVGTPGRRRSREDVGRRRRRRRRRRPRGARRRPRAATSMPGDAGRAGRRPSRRRRARGRGLDPGHADVARRRRARGAARRRGRRRTARARGRRRARTGARPRSRACGGATCARRRPGSKCAASSAISVVSSSISVSSPPIVPASPIGPRSSVMSRSSRVEGALDVVEGLELLPRAGAAHDDRALQLALGRTRAAAGPSRASRSW